MNRVFIFLIVLMASIPVLAQRFDVDTVAMTGQTDQRINMVFLSDGYQAGELEKFISDVHWMMDALFAKPPYSGYRNYFNSFAIKVPSEVSGAANDPDSLINNYFGSTFNYAGIWRLVVPTRKDRVQRVLADNFPAYDQVFVIVNDNRYGGSGGWVATSTVNSDGPEICIHELGHSFGGLSDEYWVGANYARENINMTMVADPAKVKWQRWLGYNSVGIFPHSESPEWYRPAQNCEMRYLNRNFCPVCREAITDRILDLTSPILGFTPENGNPGIVSDTIFRVELLKPKTNTLKIWWELNRNEIAHQEDSLRLSTGLLSPGPNELTCFILDTTNFIRDTLHPAIHMNQVTWNIDYRPLGTNINARSGKTNISVYPNPVYESINLSYASEIPSGGNLAIKLVDLSGKQVTRQFSFPVNPGNNQYSIPLPRRKLAAGVYYLLAQAPDHLFRLPVIIGN